MDKAFDLLENYESDIFFYQLKHAFFQLELLMGISPNIY